MDLTLSCATIRSDSPPSAVSTHRPAFFLHLSNLILTCFQDVKKAILEDILTLGKEAGLKSFEQVTDAMFDNAPYMSHLISI